MYLLSYELDFLAQFKPLVGGGSNLPAVPEYPGPMWDVVDTMLACTTSAELAAADLPGAPYLRYVASELLDLFRWLKRFADDITAGPNRYIERLLCTNQTVLGGRIHGLYPKEYLTLERQDLPLYNHRQMCCA